MTRRSLTLSSTGSPFWLLAAVLIAGCEGNTLSSEPAAGPRPNTALVANERTTVDTVVADLCTGEDIALTGTAHVVFSTSQSDGSGFHLEFQMNQVLSGTGLTTGRHYRSITTSAFTLNMDGLPLEQTSAGSSRLLGQGAGGDLVAHFTQHITVDAGGNLRVFKTDFRFECT
jgi:hypothetical protein